LIVVIAMATFVVVTLPYEGPFEPVIPVIVAIGLGAGGFASSDYFPVDYGKRKKRRRR